jgi:hypothetical protein
MAFVTTFTCGHCRQQRHEVVTHSRICATCRATIAKADEAAHMAKLAALPLEERVRRVEQALYNLDADSRLKALEAANARYA